MRVAVIEVGDVGGRRRPPADVDRLADRVEVAVAQRIADVGVVEAAVPAGLRGQRGQLGGRGVATGRVVEPGAQPERAVGHRFTEERAHPVEGSLVGRDVIPAERPDPKLRVADERGDVEADRPVEAVQEGRHRGPVVVEVRASVQAGIEVDEGLEVRSSREWRKAVPVDPDDLGGHALADLRFVPAVGQDDQAAVAVEIDEAGRHHLPGRVDRPADVRRERRIRFQDP